jgi:pimeloyl-ACP methyl ester carboxylesterase
VRLFALTLAICLSSAAGFAQTASVPPETYYGQWLGKGPALPNGPTLSTGIEIFARADGTPGAFLAVPEQGQFNLNMDRVAITGDRLTAAVTQIGLEIRLKATGHSLIGEGQQGNFVFPLELLPVKSFGEPLRSQTPMSPLPYQVEELVVRTPDGTLLSGTFTRPRGRSRVPVAVLLAGSGPWDRDEAAIPGHHPFAVIADYLARQGIATYRYDKRGIKRSTGDFWTSVPEQLAADGLAAVNTVRARQDVGPVGLIGHSEGGGLAPMIAAQAPRSVDFVVSLAGPGLKGLEMMLLQDRVEFEHRGLSATDVETLMAYDRRFYDTVIGHADTDGRLKALKALQAELSPTAQDLVRRFASQGTLSLAWASLPSEREMLTHDVPADWRRVRCPVLALNGTLDTQVPADEDLAAISAALQEGGNARHEVAPLPGLNHLFQHAKTGTADEYAALDETISPEVLQRLARFILAQR